MQISQQCFTWLASVANLTQDQRCLLLIFAERVNADIFAPLYATLHARSQATRIPDKRAVILLPMNILTIVAVCKKIMTPPLCLSAIPALPIFIFSPLSLLTFPCSALALHLQIFRLHLAQKNIEKQTWKRLRSQSKEQWIERLCN